MRDPFHDLHHQESAGSSHIRLISEGGNSHARTPDLICIDSIQATQTCTTESQHTVYRSATACNMAASHGTSLCSLAADHALELDNGLIPELLRHRLDQIGRRLGAGARLSVRDPGRLWCLTDNDRVYSLRRGAARIAVQLDV